MSYDILTGESRACTIPEKTAFSDCFEEGMQGRCVALLPPKYSFSLRCMCMNGYTGSHCETFDFFTMANIHYILVLFVFLLVIIITLVVACTCIFYGKKYKGKTGGIFQQNDSDENVPMRIFDIDSKV